MKQKVTYPLFEKFAVKNKSSIICLTDANVYNLYTKKFKGIKTIVIEAGEASKQYKTVSLIIEKLIAFGADKTTTLIGVGGGTITDITGFVASIYMRGIDFEFVPTTLLAMVDASLGGKNGINFNNHKNFVGTINQPNNILVDINFLQTLPLCEWQNGFAEIIKHACIGDATMFNQLKKNDIKFYQKNKIALTELIKLNANFKLNIVAKDVNEKGDRKLLNFGHTLGHAIEPVYKLSHGFAISIGMCFAGKLSKKYLQFSKFTEVENLLKQYQLPISFNYNKKKILGLLKMDKKKEAKKINFILLNKIGKATIYPISIDDIENLFE